MPAMDKTTAGQRLREVRERKGLTVDDVAERMGVSKSEISRLENGKRALLDFGKFEKWASSLGVRSELVLWEEGEFDDHAAGFVELLPEASPESVGIARDVVALWTHLSPDNRDTLIGLLGAWRRAIESKRRK